MRRLFALLALAALGLVPAAAFAFSAQNEQSVTLAKGQTKTGTYFVSGQAITIDGDVDGDLVCAGNTVTINGAVRGDVLCAAQTITIAGPVDGSVRVAGQTVNVNNTVGRNGMVAAQTLAMASAANLAGDLGVLAQTASINGQVGKDLYTQVEDLKLGPEAKVGGQTIKAPKPQHHRDEDAEARAVLAMRLYWMIAGLLVGLTLIWLLPRFTQKVTTQMLKHPGPSLGWGLILTIVAPVLAILLFISVVGIPLGLIVGAIWLFALLMSGIFAGIAVGHWLVERADWQTHVLVWATVLGVPITMIAFSLPVVGWLAAMVGTWWAVGGLALTARSLRG